MSRFTYEARPTPVASVTASTGSVAAASTTTVAVAWPTALSDSVYVVVASVEDSSGDLRVLSIASKTASQVVVRVQNTSVVQARTGSLHLVALVG